MSSSSTAQSSAVQSSAVASSTAAASSSSAVASSSAVQSSSAAASSSQAASASQSQSVSASQSASQTSSAQASSQASSNSAASATSATPYTSTVVVTRTNSDGSVVTTTSQIVGTATGSSGNGGGDSGNHTGAIVGGVVGGVVGLILIAGLLWFFCRKRRSSRDDFDDSMFDPSRTQNHARVDLADPGAPTVEPFYTPGVASTAASPEMSQYPRSAATTSDGGFGPGAGASGVSRGPSSAASSAGFAGRGAGPGGVAGYGNGGMPPMPTIPDQYATGAGAAAVGAGAGAGAGAGTMNAKQREAYQEHQRFHVANQPYGSQAGGSGVPDHSGPVSPGGSSSPTGVTVHTDGGVVNEDEPQALGSEIPPTYDSIRR